MLAKSRLKLYTLRLFFGVESMPVRNSALLRAACVVLLMVAGASAHAAGDVARGKLLAYTCLGCHGIADYKNVYPTYSVPKLAGQHPEYLAAALKAYRSQERSHATMHAQAASLSDEDISDIAAYFAGEQLKAGGATTGTAPSKVTELCVACHGKDGVGITPDYPNLAGQHWDYLERALLDYKRGARKNAVMPGFVSTLSEADIRAIAEYYAQQKPGLNTVARPSFWFTR
jgi:cytochrome c553